MKTHSQVNRIPPKDSLLKSLCQEGRETARGALQGRVLPRSHMGINVCNERTDHTLFRFSEDDTKLEGSGLDDRVGIQEDPNRLEQ